MNRQEAEHSLTTADGLFDFSQIKARILAGRVSILSAVAASFVAAVFYLLVTPPVYRADSLLQVQDSSSMALPGMSLLSEFSGMPTGIAETEIQLIQSRSVIGDTVERLNLTTEVAADYFPLIGYAISRFRSRPLMEAGATVPENSGNWLTNYLWAPGGMRIDRFIVPERLYGEEFTVRALGRDKYVLFGPDGERWLLGTVGAVSGIDLPSGERVELFVSEIAASAYPSDYVVTNYHWLESVVNLQNTIAVTELGRDSMIVRVSLEGEDRSSVTRIVNSVAETYLRQNVEAQSTQAARRLEILDRQLPELKHAMNDAELALDNYREENLALDLGVEARALLEQVVEIEQQMSEFELKRAELGQTYTPEHPYLRAIDDQVRSLGRTRGQIEVEIEALPDSQREMLQLTRDVGVASTLYMEFLNNAQELRLVESGSIGNVRIIDDAVVPIEPVKPQAMLVLVAALLFGLMAGILLVVIRANPGTTESSK